MREKGAVSAMLRRRVTGIGIAVVLVALWIVQGYPLRVGLMLMQIVSICEMYSAYRARGVKPVSWVGIVYGLLAMPLYVIRGTASLMPLTALCMTIGLGCVVLRGKVDFESASATLFPLFYPGLLFSMIFPLQDLKPQLFASVAVALPFLIALMNDLFAYEVGMRFGKTPLAPEISPKKTVEGAVAGLIASIVFSVLIPLTAQCLTNYVPALYAYQAPLPPLWHFAVLGLLGGMTAPIGDLTASMVKRHCGIKDFGSIFPGHGGMLDRMDSVLFTGAIIYVYFQLVLQLL